MTESEGYEPIKHRKARQKLEQYLINQNYEILSNNKIECYFNYFSIPFWSVSQRFSTRIQYVHEYDIVAGKEIFQSGQPILYVLDVFEIDGWDTKHGENSSLRTRRSQSVKDTTAEGIFGIFSDIIRIFNPKSKIATSFQRVLMDEILKCKTNEDIKKYLNEAVDVNYSKERREIITNEVS